MRVIAGLYKRRLLEAPSGTEITRPTSDRVKESLFNILAPEIEGASVLDLFAGSGALGIEALSRGAKHVTFVESNKLALTSIHKNLASLKIPAEEFSIIPKNVEDFLTSIKKIKETFDIIFADPPYNSNWLREGLQTIENSGYCAENCLFVFERPSKHRKDQPEELNIPQNWSLQDVRKYGKTQLEFWRRNYDQTIHRTA